MSNLWFGTAESLMSLARDMKAVEEKYGSLNAARHQVKLLSDDDDYDPNPVSYETIGSVAVLGINGPTVTKSNFWTQLLGIASYDDIKVRMNEAFEDPSVKGVMLNIDSPGGNADGCFSLSDFIYEFNAKVMPVVSYDNNSQCSAAVLYGSAAGQMIGDKYAEIGSIGAVAVHREITKALEMAGIKATVFRSAPYKALGLPYEKLTDAAKEEIQTDLMRGHNRFVAAVSHNTGIKLETVQSWATGKVFEANDALKMGLLDSIQPFENVIANLNKRLENAPRKGQR